jgi:hypothetical protein
MKDLISYQEMNCDRELLPEGIKDEKEMRRMKKKI